MIFTSTEPTTTPSGWEQFWQSVVDFFMVKDDKGLNYLTRILIAVGTIVIAYFLIKFIAFLLKKAFGIRKKGPGVDVTAKYFIVQSVKVILWIGVAFMVIGTLKIDTSGFAGVVSAVTVALGLALQDLVMAFASGILIIHQKHFKAGDFIGVTNSYGTQEGTVLKVQIFFTYLQTPNGQELTIPNSNMLKAVVTNYTQLGKRRLNYDVGVSYDTDIEVAKKAYLDLIKDDPRVLKDEECTVYLYELGAYSVGIRIRLWTKPEDYWPLYNELSEKILLASRANGIYIPSSTDLNVTNQNK